jgi:hypothetical protein
MCTGEADRDIDHPTPASPLYRLTVQALIILTGGSPATAMNPSDAPTQIHVGDQ